MKGETTAALLFLSPTLHPPVAINWLQDLLRFLQAGCKKQEARSPRQSES
jgi:hypothetical protein